MIPVCVEFFFFFEWVFFAKLTPKAASSIYWAPSRVGRAAVRERARSCGRPAA